MLSTHTTLSIFLCESQLNTSGEYDVSPIYGEFRVHSNIVRVYCIVLFKNSERVRPYVNNIYAGIPNTSMDSEDLFEETPELAGHLDGLDGKPTPSNGLTNGQSNQQHANGVAAAAENDDDDETQMPGIDDEELAGAAEAAAAAVVGAADDDMAAAMATNGDDDTEFDEAAAEEFEAIGGEDFADDDATEMPEADGDGEEETTAGERPAIRSAASANAANGEPRLSQLPLSRIKALMKLNPDAGLASAEAIFLMCKATELFIESLTKESFVYTAEARKKTVQRKDVEKAIESVDALMFLEGAMV